eukprot:12917254-Prorocentrum_lima.AAC.1
MGYYKGLLGDVVGVLRAHSTLGLDEEFELEDDDSDPSGAHLWSRVFCNHLEGSQQSESHR